MNEYACMGTEDPYNHCMYLCVYLYICLYSYTRTCIYMHTCVYTFTTIDVCMYVYTCIFTRTILIMKGWLRTEFGCFRTPPFHFNSAEN